MSKGYISGMSLQSTILSFRAVSFQSHLIIAPLIAALDASRGNVLLQHVHELGLGQRLRDHLVGALGDEGLHVLRQSVARHSFVCMMKKRQQQRRVTTL